MLYGFTLKSGWRDGLDLRLNAWQIVRTPEKNIKVVKGNTSNLMNHLKTKHSTIYEEMIRKTDKSLKINYQGVSPVC